MRKRVIKIFLGSWNICTLLGWDNVSRPERQTTLVDKELACYTIDIIMLSETRLAEKDS